MMKSTFWLTITALVASVYGNGECCTSVLDAVPKEFPELAGLLQLTGLIDAVPSFRGTIFAPTDDAITTFVTAVNKVREEMNVLVEDEAFVAVVKEIVLYHLVPDAAVFSGQVMDRRVRLNTLFTDVDSLEAVCSVLGYGPPKSTVVLKPGASSVFTGAVNANVVAGDLEFCGPIVVHAVDQVLVPCEHP